MLQAKLPHQRIAHLVRAAAVIRKPMYETMPLVRPDPIHEDGQTTIQRIEQPYRLHLLLPMRQDIRHGRVTAAMAGQYDMPGFRMTRDNPGSAQLLHYVSNKVPEVTIASQLSAITICRVFRGFGQDKDGVTLRVGKLPCQTVKLQRGVDIVVPAMEPEYQVHFSPPPGMQWRHQQHTTVIVMPRGRAKYAVTVKEPVRPRRVREARKRRGHTKGLIPLIPLRQQ